MKERYRILYVEPAARFGGGAASLLRLLSKLDKRRYEPIVLVRRPGALAELFRKAGVEVVCLSDKPLDHVAASEALRSKRDIAVAIERYSPRLAAAYRTAKVWLAVAQKDLGEAGRIAALIRRLRIDLVHLNNRIDDTRSAALAAVISRTPCVCHVRFYGSFRGPDRWIARRIRHHIFISRAVADDTRTRMPGLPGSIIYDGVDLPTALSGEQRRRVRAEWGWNDADFVIGNAGRIVEWKGQAVFLRALARIVPHSPQIRALIIGDIDPPEDAHYLRRLQALVTGLGLEERVCFSGHYDDMPTLLGALDAVVHTATLPEPFGLVVIEGMAAGRPVVASAAGGILDIVTNDRVGVLTPMGDEVALAKALRRLADDPELGRRLGDSGRAHVAAHFSGEQFIGEVEGIYRKMFSSVKSQVDSHSSMVRERVQSDPR